MHTLEDAFLQIGQDTNVDRIEMNNSNTIIHGSPSFSFKNQISALFMRKFYSSFRKLSNIFMMLLPIVYIMIGSFVQNYIFTIADQEEAMKDAKGDFTTLSIFIIQGYCFKSSIFLILPVAEKETRLRHLLIISGCRKLSYWLGNFLFDIFIYLFGVAVFFVSMILMLTYNFNLGSNMRLLFTLDICRNA